MAVVKSKWTIPLPSCSVPTWLFGPPGTPLENPHKRMYIDADREDSRFMTHESFLLWSKRFAAGLHKAGLQPGDRVVLFSGNDLFFPVAFMGVVMAGGIFSAANPTFVARELAYQLKDLEAKFLLCAEGVMDVALEATVDAGIGRDAVFVFDDCAVERSEKVDRDVPSWSALIASEEDGAHFEWTEPVSPQDTTCCINYSSGTTGLPKGVEMAHSCYLAAVQSIVFLQGLDLGDEGPNSENWLVQLPMYHAWAQALYCVLAPKCRVPVYIMPRFDVLKSLSHIQQHKITRLTVVPAMANAIANYPQARSFNLSSVRRITAAGSPLGLSARKSLESLWATGDIVIEEAVGSTETAMVAAWGSEPPVPSSTGFLAPNVEARIVSLPEGHDSDPDKAQSLPRNQSGELWIRGPSIMNGYWRNPAATAACITPDGWYRSGDIAYFDERGRLFIVGRKKELIKVMGGQISPSELEMVLLDHKGVLDAAVVGVKVDENDERPRAYVVLRPESQVPLTEEGVLEWMKTRVAPYKQITGGVVFVDAIPKNPTGKILRDELRGRALAEVLDAIKTKTKDSPTLPN